MSQNGNAYRELTPEMKLQLFSFEAERFLTSIIGYSKLLLVDAEKPPLETALSDDFVESLDAIQRTGSKFARLIREVSDPDEDSPYQGNSPRQSLTALLSESGGLIPIITGYSAVLETEAHKPDFPSGLPPRFMDNLDMLQTAATRLSKTREELFESMK